MHALKPCQQLQTFSLGIVVDALIMVLRVLAAGVMVVGVNLQAQIIDFFGGVSNDGVEFIALVGVVDHVLKTLFHNIVH